MNKLVYKIIDILSIEIIKVVPIIITMWLLVVTTLLLNHVKHADLEYSILGHSLIYNVSWLCLSIKYRFCIWHRVLIYNLILINILEWINNRFQVFTNKEVIYTMTVLLCVTIFISLILKFKYGCIKRVTNNHIKKITTTCYRNDRY